MYLSLTHQFLPDPDVLLNPRPQRGHVHSPEELKMSLGGVLSDHISFIFAQPANPPRPQEWKRGLGRRKGLLLSPLPQTVCRHWKVSAQLSGSSLTVSDVAWFLSTLTALNPDEGCVGARGQLHHELLLAIYIFAREGMMAPFDTRFCSHAH